MSELPYLANRGQTHFEGCYRERHHHNCAVARVDHLDAQLEALRGAATKLTETQPGEDMGKRWDVLVRLLIAPDEPEDRT